MKVSSPICGSHIQFSREVVYAGVWLFPHLFIAYHPIRWSMFLGSMQRQREKSGALSIAGRGRICMRMHRTCHTPTPPRILHYLLPRPLSSFYIHFLRTDHRLWALIARFCSEKWRLLPRQLLLSLQLPPAPPQLSRKRLWKRAVPSRADKPSSGCKFRQLNRSDSPRTRRGKRIGSDGARTWARGSGQLSEKTTRLLEAGKFGFDPNKQKKVCKVR